MDLDIILMILYTNRDTVNSGGVPLSMIAWKLMVNSRATELSPTYPIQLVDRLFTDGYIQMPDNLEYSPILTDEGYKFFISGGYTKTKQAKVREDKIQQFTLEQLSRSKWSFRISIIAIAVSVASLVVAITALIHKLQ